MLALEGSSASVLGGAPAAEVVFAATSTRAPPNDRGCGTRGHVSGTHGAERAALPAELDEVRSSVRAEKLGEVATEFDRVHDIQRAVEVGSVNAVIRAAELRPRLIEAIEARLR